VSERENNQQFETLLYYLQQNRGFDFTGYKRPSLMRRISKRMEMVAIETSATTSITWKSTRRNTYSSSISS
jgi:two-component system CheB/CheR fusion protein